MGFSACNEINIPWLPKIPAYLKGKSSRDLPSEVWRRYAFFKIWIVNKNTHITIISIMYLTWHLNGNKQLFFSKFCCSGSCTNFQSQAVFSLFAAWIWRSTKYNDKNVWHVTNVHIKLIKVNIKWKIQNNTNTWSKHKPVG